MSRVGFIVSLVAMVLSVCTLALVVTGMLLKRIDYFSAD